MRWRNTLILAVVVAVAWALLHLDRTRWSVKRAEEKSEASRLFPGLDAKDVDAYELRTKDGKVVRLERHKGSWRIVKPIDFPADAMAADAIASSAAELDSEAVYDHPEALKEYGLDEPPTLRFWAGKQVHELRIGDKSPVGGNTYVTDGAAKKVYAVSSIHVEPMEKTLKQLRDSRVVVFDRAAVKTIDVSWPGAAVSMVRKDDKWMLVKPISARADPDTIEALLSNLTFLRADSFVDEPHPDANALGLVPPGFQVTLGFGKGKKPVTMAIASRSKGKKRVVRGRDGYLYEIPASRVPEFRHGVVAYRFKELSQFASVLVGSFQVTFHPKGAAKATVLTVTKNAEGGWKATPEAIAPGKASRIVSELSRLKAVDVAAESMGQAELAGLGLSPPRAEIRVFGEGKAAKKLLADVRFGNLEGDKGIPAMRPDSKAVFWLDPYLAHHVPITLASYRKTFAAKEKKPEKPSKPAPAAGKPSATPAPAGH